MRFQEFNNIITESADRLVTYVSNLPVDVPSKGNPEIAILQTALVGLGYKLPVFGIDGKRKHETNGAIKKFQEDNKLKPTGIPDANTVSALNDAIKMVPAIVQKIKDRREVKGHSGVKSVSAPAPASLPRARNGKTFTPSKINITQYSPEENEKIRKLLDFIAMPESGGDYNVISGGKKLDLTSMTIGDIYNLQKIMRLPPAKGGYGTPSNAVGRYQFMPNTLKEVVAITAGVDENTKFTPDVQDALIITRLADRRGLNDWLDGGDTKRFMSRLSQEFAGLPDPNRGGLSHYHGIGNNRAGVRVGKAYAVLSQIQSGGLA